MPWSHLSFWLAPLLIALVLTIFIAILRTRRINRLYHQSFLDSRRERLFLASVGFFVAVGVVRGITEAIHHHFGPFHDVSLHGRHIHHLVWGILLLLLVGYGWLVEIGSGAPDSSRWAGRLMALLYGVGAALTLDEFALWLNLRDVYWEHEGRESLEALALFGALLSAGVFGARFFQVIGREAVQPGKQ
ncbi:MAG: hypothetical protein JO182_00135 [Acidobacteriaceae bacterium]|nr:hypothetical protein [Acidobacteriaceae bacterium]MBV9675843.1 hypothetical protein [Acidobacteriaceae bacterium]